MDSSAHLPSTESRHPRSAGLGELSAEQVIALMAEEEPRVLSAVDEASNELALAARKVAEVFLQGGRILLLGSGTSGRLAVQEVAELAPTFGVPPEQFLALVATRAAIGPAAVAVTEDDVEAVQRAIHDL